MHCPQCGQQQVSNETRFCSRCGFLLTGIAEVVANQGVIPASEKTGLTGKPDSPRRRGIKQGVFLFLLVFLLAPLAGMLTIAMNIKPFFVGMAVVLCVVGGLLRTLYALMFESGAGSAPPPFALAGTENRSALPPSQSVPASAYVSPAAGSWRDTNDLQHQPPGSVTDTTTKLLQKDDQ